MKKQEINKDDLKFAKQAVIFTTTLTVIIALYELAHACLNYKHGMNIFDLGFLASRDDLTYSIIFILITTAFLPYALLMYKEKGISLKDEIYEKKTLLRDIGLGILALAVKYVITGTYYLIRPDSSLPSLPSTRSTLVIATISLVFVSGILKEIYYRGFAKTFVSPILGSTMSFFLFNLLFGILDWPNLGASFVSATVWTYFYRKSGHLITPMIAHGGTNLIYILTCIFC